MSNRDGGTSEQASEAKFEPLHTSNHSKAWLVSEGTWVYKTQKEQRGRSHVDVYEMHKKAYESLRDAWRNGYTSQIPREINIPKPFASIEANDTKWWRETGHSIPEKIAPCSILVAQYIVPFERKIKTHLIHRLFSSREKKQLNRDEDFLIRPYLVFRPPGFERPLSLHNYPFYLDDMMRFEISKEDIISFARTMAVGLAVLHWSGSMDGNGIEFVFAPNIHRRISPVWKNERWKYVMWMLDFDLVRPISHTKNGMKQAAKAFWDNDPYYPRPDNRDLWSDFKDQYLSESEALIRRKHPQNANQLINLSKTFIANVEMGMTGNRP
ncbi:zinc finger protein-domain-containing protein [Aspergillus coremiiformis]|uniref:Zinc finger protein-domain-containing protein n=1 Tax=Aspergillus coremiiformis TaxID=138285 RepID=A0A5N6ZJ55_9EURO|nr:zinc finger protein-domain-containing protein [Aspergillus coremiiformis]